MGRRVVAALSLALLAGALGACGIVDTIDPRYNNVNRSTARARDEAILLNIVRASRNVPMNFVSLSKVSGMGQVQAGAGLPSFLLGPFIPFLPEIGAPQPPDPQRAVAISSTTLNGGGMAQNNFDISMLETKEFYSALMRPVDLVQLHFFMRQGYSRELLFWLFTQSVRETMAGQTVEFVNTPDLRRSCRHTRGVDRCFRDMVDVAVASGLTVETRTDLTDNKTYARLCFDHVLADTAKQDYSSEIFRFFLAPPSGHRPRCKVDPWEQRGTKAPDARPGAAFDTLYFRMLGTPSAQYEIVTRSTFTIYQFLGRILHLNLQDEFGLRGMLQDEEDRRFLGLQRSSDGGCFVDLTFEGDYFCVPRRGAENTKRIFGLLAQLVALNTLVGDLAITPTVRTIQ